MGFNIFDRLLNEKGEDPNDDEKYYNDNEDETSKENPAKGGQVTILIEPRSYSEAETIATSLKQRNSVVVNLKRVTSDQAKRIIDFLSGCIFAIGGSMDKIGVGIYLCTPKNITVQGTISEDSDKAKNSSKKSTDEMDW